jgi:hypothetical protein
LFTYHGSKGSGSSPHVTGHINALFPWAHPASYPLNPLISLPSMPAQGMVWVGLEGQKRSFPGGMNSVPMRWKYLDRDFAMTAWAGSMCACVSEDSREVAPALCVGFTIDALQNPAQP